MSFEPVKGYTEHEAFNVTIPAKSLYIQKYIANEVLIILFDRGVVRTCFMHSIALNNVRRISLIFRQREAL